MDWIKRFCSLGALFALATSALAATGGWTFPGQSSQQAGQEQPNVTVKLIAEKNALQPQATNQLGVVIDQKNGWHTYWLMPGDAGFPSRFTFNLPSGFNASEPQFPLPERLDMMGIISYAYNGEAVFPFQVQTPGKPSASTETTITIDVDYLACKDVCIPGHASASLTLPVSTQGTLTEDAPKLQKAIEHLPEKITSPDIVARRHGENVKIHVPQSVRTVHHNLDFLPLDANAYVLSQAPQFVRESDGSATVYLTLTPEFAATNPTTLKGVLVADDGPERQGGWAMETELTVTEGTFTRPTPVATMSVVNPEGGEQLTVWAAIAFAFIGGLILNLMPCVFPVLSLKLLHLVEGHRQGSPLLPHGIAFTAGVLLSMVALSGLLIALRSLGMAFGWGFQLQTPWVVSLLLLLFVGITLNLLGVFEFTLGARLGVLTTGKRTSAGVINSFLMGILAVVIASPCTAPFMGAALGYALTRPSIEAFLIFLALGFGMALPWLLLCVFPSWARCLPKPGAWMEKFRRIMAIPMLGASLWLAWVLSKQITPLGLALVGLAVIAVILAAWLLGRQQWGESSTSLWPWALGLSSVGLIVCLGLGTFNQVPVQNTQEHWEAWSPEAVEQSLAQGRPVFVDFTAAWCITCQANKVAALNRDEVQNRFASLGYVTLVGDWTNYDKRITAELEKFHRSGVPLYLVYHRNGQITVLPELLTPSIVIKALDDGVSQ